MAMLAPGDVGGGRGSGERVATAPPEAGAATARAAMKNSASGAGGGPSAQPGGQRGGASGGGSGAAGRGSGARLTVLLCVLSLLAGVAASRLPATVASLRGEFRWEDAIRDVHRLIVGRYVDEPDQAALMKGAIKGMTDALNDPYTQFIAPEERAKFEKELTGQFVGIGATVNVQAGWLTIVYPLPRSPAYRAGLWPGDRVVKIGGDSTQGLTVEQCVEKLLGKPGSRVELTVQRAGREGEMAVGVDRGEINAPSVMGVRWEARRPGQVAVVGGGGAAGGGGGVGEGQSGWRFALDAERGLVYVRVAQFTPTTAEEVQGALESAGDELAAAGRARKPGAVILDLRDNPGGLMDQAIEVVRLFMTSGPIVSTKGRTVRGEAARAEEGRSGAAPFADVPLAVLVNQSSASASEIVAGALADNGRAVVVGVRTFGKGLVQRIEPLPNVPGAQLKLTEQRYVLPAGRTIHRTDDSKEWGVDPTGGMYTPLTEEQQVRLARARRAMELVRPAGFIEAVRGGAWKPGEEFTAVGAVIGEWEKQIPVEAKWSDADWVEKELGDPVLAVAMRAAGHRVAQGAWPAEDWRGAEGKVPAQVARIRNAELLTLERLAERLGREMERVEKRLAALEEGADPAKLAEARRLWAETIDLTGGRIEVFDRAGKVVAVLDVTGPDVQRWLVDAEVKARATQSGDDAKPADGPRRSEESAKAGEAGAKTPTAPPPSGP